MYLRILDYVTNVQVKGLSVECVDYREKKVLLSVCGGALVYCFPHRISSRTYGKMKGLVARGEVGPCINREIRDRISVIFARKSSSLLV